MSDWADEKAEILLADAVWVESGVDLQDQIASALRAARVEGMKEARELIERYPTSTTDARFQIIGRINARISALESITLKDGK